MRRRRKVFRLGAGTRAGKRSFLVIPIGENAVPENSLLGS